jgi:flagellar protein FlaG
MEINKNHTNTNPVDSKSSGFPALQMMSAKGTKENVVEIAQAKRLSEVKQEKIETKQTETETEDLFSVVVEINEHVQSIQRDLVFTVDEVSGRDVVTIRDTKSNEVIRQIPSEEMLRLARNLNEQLKEDDAAKTVNLFSSIA